MQKKESPGESVSWVTIFRPISIMNASNDFTLILEINSLTLLRGSSHYTSQVKRLLPKLLSRGEGRSPLKYIMSVLLSYFEYFIEKKFHLSTRVWVFILGESKLLPRGRTLGAKSAKKCYHVRILEAFHFWSLVINMKAQRQTSRSSPIKLLVLLHLSTN